MTAVIHRSALVFHGHNPAPDVAYIVRDFNGTRTVTWDDVLVERRERQRRILTSKRDVQPEFKAYKVWVAYFDQNIFGGWHAFVENRDECVWVDRDQKHMVPILMELFPILLPCCDSKSFWDEWKKEFARRFMRRRQCRRPVGVAYIWWNRQGSAKRS